MITSNCGCAFTILTTFGAAKVKPGTANSKQYTPGGPVVNVHTEHGQVTVRKASADDKPITPKEDVTESQIPTPSKPLKKVEQ